MHLTLSVRKRRWIEGVPGRRFDLDEVKNGVLIDEILAEIEKVYILKALESDGMNKGRAAELLGINLSRVLKNNDAGDNFCQILVKNCHSFRFCGTFKFRINFV